MSTYVLATNVRVGTVQHWAGTIVDSDAEDTSVITAAGGALIPTGNSFFDNGGVFARAARARGANLDEVQSYMTAALALFANDI